MRVFLLEARDHRDIFANGTNRDFANRINNQGNVIIMEALKPGNASLDAEYAARDNDEIRIVNAAMALASGQRYDKLGGWLKRDWTEKERINVHLEYLNLQKNNLPEVNEEKVENVAQEGVARRSSISAQRPLASNPAAIPGDLQEGLESNASGEGVRQSGSEDEVLAETYENQEGIAEVEEEQQSSSPRRESISLFGLSVASSSYNVPEGKQEKHLNENEEFEPGSVFSEEDEVNQLNKAFDQIPKRKIGLMSASQKQDEEDHKKERAEGEPAKKEPAEGELAKKVIIKR